jgi:hypothetical protein
LLKPIKGKGKNISCLKQGDAIFSKNKDMVDHARQFYKTLFGEEPRANIKLDEELWDVEERVTQVENDTLEAKMTEEEIFQAIKGSYAKGSLGPDGFSFLFYYKFWSIIKGDFMALVREFNKGDPNIVRLNYAMVILIPKEENDNTLKNPDLLVRSITALRCLLKL